MILVTGATGTVGRQVVSQLSERGVPLRAVSRDPASAGLPPGVQVVRGELADPESLKPQLVTQPEPVTRTVEEITGTPARPFRQWAADHASDFRPLSVAPAS